MLRRLFNTNAVSATTAFQTRFQSMGNKGMVRPGAGGFLRENQGPQAHHRKLNVATLPHYVKAAIQNDRQALNLPEVVDWEEFAEGAQQINTRAGPLWIGTDDPRVEKLMKRRDKMHKKPNQVARRSAGPDLTVKLEDHKHRSSFTTPSEIHNPLSVAESLLQAGMIKQYDVKHTASKIKYVSRAPIVSVMGHVDHGKTTLLDFLRKTNVAAGEAGGITQSIGAFHIQTGDRLEDNITFIDTPGHAAFATMREAGAEITDIIVLVISAVDGIQPQTKEVLELAQQNAVPLVIAANKIDRQPDLTMLKKQLREADVELEEDGGDVQLVGISAVDGTGIPDLLEAIQLQAAICEIVTPQPSRAEVYVTDSKSTKHTLLKNEVCGIVKCGTVRPGMTLVSGMTYAVVKDVFDESASKKLAAGANTSIPVVLTGFKMLPKPGVTLMQVTNEQHALRFMGLMRDVYKVEGNREVYLQRLSREASGNFWDRKPDNNLIRVNTTVPVSVICKAATFGMLQALLRLVYELPTLPGIDLKVKVSEVGGVGDHDIARSQLGGNATVFLIFGDVEDSSNFQIPSYAHQLRFDVVYHGIQFLKEKLVEAMPKIKRVRVVGKATCQDTFRASQAGLGNAGGVLVDEGTLDAQHLTYRVVRKVAGKEEPDTVYDGPLRELRRFKDKVPTVEQGLECGMIMEDDFMFRKGDVVEMYEHYEEDRDVEEEFEAAAKRERLLRLQAMHDEMNNADEDTPTDAKAA